MDTFAAFEIKNGLVKDNIIVFHLSFGTNSKAWNIIQAEYPDFFSFMKKCVLTDMEDWIKNDDVEDYI